MLQEQNVHFCAYTAQEKHLKGFTQQQDIFLQDCWNITFLFLPYACLFLTDTHGSYGFQLCAEAARAN